MGKSERGTKKILELRNGLGFGFFISKNCQSGFCFELGLYRIIDR